MSDKFVHILNIREVLLQLGGDKEGLNDITYFVKAQDIPEKAIDKINSEGMLFIESLKYDGQARIYELRRENLEQGLVLLNSRRAALGTNKDQKAEAKDFNYQIGAEKMLELFKILEGKFGKDLLGVKIVAEIVKEQKSNVIYCINIIVTLNEEKDFWFDQIQSFEFFEKMQIRFVEHFKEHFNFKQVMERFQTIDQFKGIEGKVYSQVVKEIEDVEKLFIFKLKTQEYLAKEALGNSNDKKEQKNNPKQKKLNPTDFVNPALFEKAEAQFAGNGKLEEMVEYMINETWQQFDEQGGKKEEWQGKIDLAKIITNKYQAFKNKK